MRRLLFFNLSVIAWICILLTSCDKFEGDQTVPAYLQIDTIKLSVPDPAFGSATSNITDAWVYVDDEPVGCFELPAVIPLLKTGKHEITIGPGIKLSTQSGLRAVYSFYEPVIMQNIRLAIDSVTIVSPVTHYYDNTTFAFIEDFEDGSSVFKMTSKSDTAIAFVANTQATDFYGAKNGLICLTAEKDIFEGMTNYGETYGYEFPSGGKPVFMELDYNSNNSLTIGILIRKTTELIQTSLLVLNPTGGKWKKAYVNFSSIVLDYSSAEYFNFFVGAVIDDGIDTAMIKLDNIKLVHKPLN
jgi:hypothetical protein